MDNLVFSINSVLPIFLVIMIGYGIKRLGYLDRMTARKMNAIVFNFAMPIMLFRDMANSNLKDVMDGKFIAFALLTTTTSFLTAWLIARAVIKDRKKIGAFVQGSFRGNYVFIGLPLVANILGGEAPSIALAVTTFVVPYYNILAVIILTVYGAEKRPLGDTVLQAVKNIARNPLIWGILVGVCFSVLGLRLPQPISVTCNYMSNIASPTALLCIGANLTFGNLGDTMKETLLVAFLKLVAVPLAFVSLAVKLGFPGESIAVLFVMYAAPTAVASYTMAVMMGSDEQLASNIVVVTSLLSVVTFTIGVFILKTAAII